MRTQLHSLIVYGVNNLMYRVSWLEVNGTIYKPGGVVVLSMEADPTFGLIEDIIVFSTDVFYLVCEELTTDCFNSHFHS